MKNYLCVFHSTHEGNDEGDDPGFSSPPTWGICRPNVRVSWTTVGSRLVFVGRRKDGTYFFRCIFRVGRKLGYIEALKEFPTRKNVIIRGATDYIQPRLVKWKYSHFKEKIIGARVPEFLDRIRLPDGTLLQQNPEDCHEVDNWKCQRMFRCSLRQIERCFLSGRCHRESEFPNLKGYLVADEWVEPGPMLINWDDVAPARLPSHKLRTPYNQHNALSLSPEEVREVEERALQLGAVRHVSCWCPEGVHDMAAAATTANCITRQER